MDATQRINDLIVESDEDENEEEDETKRGPPLAKLCILKNEHIPETELPLYLGDNVLGRDPNTCTQSLPAPSISKQHATICISVYRRRGCHSEVDTEALVWDLGSMNGTRKGHLKLTPNVRYALSERDSLMVADIPCQYVICAVDAVSSQGDTTTPVSRNVDLKARLPHASGEKEGYTSTGSKKHVNGGTKARVSLPDRGDTSKTPVLTSCLTLEQTPTQPQGSLVPESDSDSGGEREDRRRKSIVSDSDSHKSSPTSSTFLSPTNKTVPESEDESPITPSSNRNRPLRHVTFSAEETDVDVGRQQLKKHKALAIVSDSEEEEESGQHVPVKQESNVSLTGEDELPVFSPTVFTDVIPEFHMDSDTDVDEDDDALDKVPKGLPSSADHTKPRGISLIQPEGITMDSDTDVDDDEEALSDAATKAKPTSLQSTHAADSAPSTLANVHLDSDTDVDEGEERELGTSNKCSKIDESPTRLDTKPESAPAVPRSLHVDSDTDDEAAPFISDRSVASAVTESRTAADAGADLGILSDSDTDVEGDSPLVIPVIVSALSADPGAMSDSDADTDVDESSVPPAGDGVNPADLRVDSDTDVEDEVDFGEAGEAQIPDLCRESTPRFLVPLQQNCSTPVHVSEGKLENLETFLIPSSVPFRRAEAPAVRPIASSPSSDSLEDEDLVVAETQSFILQTRDCQGNSPEHATQASGLQSSADEKDKQSSRGGSFHLGLSDSSHLQGLAQTRAMESSQGFVSVVGGVNLEDTQAYAAISNADRTSLENDPNLEATQAFGEDVGPARCSLMSAKEGQVDFSLEATQAFISESCSDSEDGINTATAETQPFDCPTSSTVATAETQPMSAFEEEEEEEEEEDSLDEENPVSSALQVKPRPQSGTEEREKHREAAQPHKRDLIKALFVAETQPMYITEDEESDDEDSTPGPQKRKAKQLWFEDEQTQTLTNSELSIVETQPKRKGEDGESDEEDLIPGPRKRRAKALQLEEESMQTRTNSDLSLVQTQPMVISGNEESDDEDSTPGPRKRKAKQLWFEDEQTQTLTNSELSIVETQPKRKGEDGESDEEDLIPGPRKRRAKALQLEQETPSLTCSETQPMGACEDEQSDEKDSTPGLRKRRAKALQLEQETQPLETKTGRQPQRGKGRQSEAANSGSTITGKRVTRARLREEEEQAECSDPPKTQTRGKNKAVPKTRGRRGKSRPDEEEEEEEEKEEKKVEQAKRTRGKKSMRQQKDNEEEEERTRKKQAENNNLIKEQEDRREKRDKLERERKEKEAQERVQAENAERLRLEQERAEKEKIEREQEEKKRADRVQKEEEEQLERERKEKEEKERLETAKRELEERLERERKEQELQARLDREAKEKEEGKRLTRLEKENREKEAKEKQIKEQQENTPATPTRSRRAARRTIAGPCTTEPEPDSTISANEDVPARRTRSRSNSSNSISSERSSSSVSTPGSRGRGRGRGAKRTSAPPPAASVRSSDRRRTAAAELITQQGSNDIPPQGALSRSNSINSINSEISSCSLSSQSRGRGGRQGGRGRKTEAEPDSIPPINSQSDQSLTPKPTARGRKSRRAEESSNEVPHDDGKEKADSQQASTTRGRRRAIANVSEPAAAEKQDPSSQEGASEESTPKRNVRGRSQKVVQIVPVEAPGAAVSDGEEAKETRKGRKRELEANTEEASSSSSKDYTGKKKAQTAEEEEETKEDIVVQVKRKGRASSACPKNNTSVSPIEVKGKEQSENMGKGTVEKKGRGRLSVVQKKKKKKEEQEESGSSVDQEPRLEPSQPQTPTSGASRKRRSLADSSPVAKTPRSSSASPAARGQLRAAGQAYKVLFTGVVDEDGERVLARLGGSMAKGVADMNCLVTDKVRRTVKFLCALAKGIPIVTTQWLEKSGKAGSFLSPNAFVVKDPEQEKKFNFCLQESLKLASSHPLLQGYEVHVTKSVKPEPVHMKDIISCSGASFLPKMPSSCKPQTVVISCEEDWPLCGPALSASLPVVTAEFILTGILQQILDLQTHKLSGPALTLQPAGGRGRSGKKT
ncbi:mediator of DNA damage checkpoint protein 1-like isoform X1 [Cottoperca gobio]|uniref:Mediator of DNA damage checkpoint protein 1 n=1 Tax=Cottoperca gobio TaxID=56716 RepID=A0A6J2R999_COTGO|nr:mediator of DNA damage checkpoint protein 1-like isoform X1 [Cottoperca gobio]XP_029306874.1 mediator of DNA damage checkpoint protein 1-like isoform X1 [Cottoperca gobio]XP_029306876.1 mediator of DNA damage checkpoint protein 1-like isoform X1 [Cottoperca gobio]